LTFMLPYLPSNGLVAKEAHSAVKLGRRGPQTHF
jgi:hypothetical protein